VAREAEVVSNSVCPPAPEAVALDQAVALLKQAERPLVIAGKGLRWHDAWQELLALVEDLQAPFIASPMGRGLLTDTHPLAATVVSGFAQKQADVVLVAGTRLNWRYRSAANSPWGGGDQWALTRRSRLPKVLGSWESRNRVNCGGVSTLAGAAECRRVGVL
jgi:thiamine pyrophosphate-dependent acetolactate synthase large subunit-like protein